MGGIVKPLVGSLTKSGAIPFGPDWLGPLASKAGEGVVFVPQPKIAGQTILFQDIAGSIPVVSGGDPVGLFLDLSLGLALGEDIFPSLGAPSIQDSGGSLGAYNANTGAISNTAVGTSATHPRFSWVVPGPKPHMLVTLRFTGEYGSVYSVGTTSNGVGLVYRSNLGADFSSELTFVIPPSATNYSFQVFCDGTSTFSTTPEISVRELRGNHAWQGTTAYKPLYQTDGQRHWLSFDGVDDSLATEANFLNQYGMSLSAGFRFNTLSGSAYRTLAGFQQSTSYSIIAVRSGLGRPQYQTRYAGSKVVAAGAASFSAGDLILSSGRQDSSSVLNTTLINGVIADEAISAQTEAEVTTSVPFVMGGTYGHDHHIFGCVGVQEYLSDLDASRVSGYINSLMGV